MQTSFCNSKVCFTPSWISSPWHVLVSPDLVELGPSWQKELDTVLFASQPPSAAISGILCFSRSSQNADLAQCHASPVMCEWTNHLVFSRTSLLGPALPLLLPSSQGLGLAGTGRALRPESRGCPRSCLVDSQRTTKGDLTCEIKIWFTLSFWHDTLSGSL